MFVNSQKGKPMSIDTNNIKVKHLNRDISIAQHTEYEGGVSKTTEVQEVAILPSGSEDWTILRYNNNLNSLIETLQNIRTLIENSSNLWSVDEIIEVFDNSPDLTLKELSQKSGWSVRELLSLLTHEDKQNV